MMIGIKVSSLADLGARIGADKEIYDSLTPEEKAEVDAHNARAREAYQRDGLRGVVACGEHPMKRFRARNEAKQG